MQQNLHTSITQLQTIPQNSLGQTVISSHNQRVKYLKENHHDLYGNLYKITNEEIILSVEAFQTYFHGQTKSASICTNQITYYYVCRTCQQDSDYKICQLCFDKNYHNNHNYYTVQQNGDCDCGFPGSGNICSQHMQIYNNQDIVNPQPEYNSYMTFLLQFLNICINIKPQIRRKHKNIINQYFQKFIKINQYNSLYIQITTFCLNQPAQSDKSNKIIFKILEINQNQIMAESLPKLFKLLISYPAFRILFVQQTFKFKNMVYQFHILNKVWRIMQKLLKVTKILSQLTYKKVEIYPQNPYLFPNICFINIVKNMMNKNKNCIKPDTNLIVLMRMMLYQKKIIPYQLTTDYKLLQFVFTKISSDHKLLILIISQLLRNKIYNELWGKQHDSQWFNAIVRVILSAMNGSIDKLPQFFIQIQLGLVIKLVKGYFRQVFRIKNKCKFNNLTAICLFKTAKYYNFVDQLNNLDIGNCINLKKFTDNLFIVLRNLVTTQHLSALHLLKIASLNGDQQKIKLYKNQIIQWFRYFIQTKKQVSQQIIRNLQQQQIINFPQAIQILVNQTTYQQETKVFIWKGAITQISQDRLLSNIKQLNILEGKIVYEDYKNEMFYTEMRQQILLAILGQNIKKVRLQKFLSYPKNQRYRMLLSGIILDSILKGKNKNVKNYIQRLQAFALKMNKNYSKFHKLFQVTQDNKQYDFVKQQIMHINNNNGPQTAKYNNLNLIITTNQLKITTSKVQIQKQLTQHQIQTNNKRNQKMQKIKQKFNKKSQKYIQSSFHTKPKAEQEVCLICRQSQAKNKYKSFLYYLGNLKTDELTQILYGAQGQGLIITSCFHPYHQKCILNNSNICILCKQAGNIILPVINQTIQSDLFVTAWWDDFISLNSFTPKPNILSYNYYGYYSNQNKTVDQGTQTKQSQIELQLKKRRPYKNLLIIYKSLVIRLCAVAVKTKWQDSLRKNTYLFNLILTFTTKLNKNQKIQLLKQLVEFEIIIKQSKITDYLKDLTIATSYLLQNILGLHLIQQQQAIGKAKQLCFIILSKYPLKLISNFIKNMQWFLQQKIIEKQKQQESKPICMAELFSYIYNFDIPDTMQDLYSIRKNCKKCNRLDSWYCLICKQIGCQHCQNPYNHMKITHKNNNSIIVLQASTGYLAEISNNVTTSHVYFDVFGNQFDQSKSLILKNYRYSKNKVSVAFNNLFKRL